MTIKSPTYVPALIALATWGCASHAAPADQLQPPSENTDAALISELKSHCGENSTVECMADPKLVYVSSPGPCETGLLSCATGTRFCAVKSEEALSLARETARAMFLQRSMRLLIDDSSRTTALLMAQAAGNEIAQTFYRVRIE